jgi:hypothetical protein
MTVQKRQVAIARDLGTLKFDPGAFRAFATEDFAQAIWVCLKEPETCRRLEVATELGRPAVEVLSEVLVPRFGKGVDDPELKRMIGRMVAQIMVVLGYRIDKRDAKISRPGLFKVGVRYARTDGAGRRCRVADRRNRGEVLAKWIEKDVLTHTLETWARDEQGHFDGARIDALAEANGVRVDKYNTPPCKILNLIVRLRTALRDDIQLLKFPDTSSDTPKGGG